MAAATDRYGNERVGFGAGTGPSSEDTWAHAAVSTGDENADPYYDKQYNDYSNDARYPLSQQSHSSSRPKTRGSVRSTATSETNGNYDRSRHRTSDNSRHASKERPRVKRKTSRGAVTTMDEAIEEDEESKWIHRDKLAKIESKELAEMGYRVSRSSSRARSKRAASVRTDAPDSVTLAGDDIPDVPIDPRTSQLNPANNILNNHDAVQDVDGFADSVSQRNNAGRTPNSRIPLPQNGTPESPTSPHYRTRSRSGSTNALAHATHNSGDDTSMSGSPPKAKKGSHPRSRNASIDQKSGLPKARSMSTSSKDAGRPKTRDGNRPPTARPEGEAPWIASMYKPDPRLPPDQQMLPTHAKRMARAQAEAEGRPFVDEDPNTEFMLLDDSGGSDNEKPNKSSPTRNPYPARDQSLSQAQSQTTPGQEVRVADATTVQRVAPPSNQPQPQKQKQPQQQQQTQVQPPPSHWPLTPTRSHETAPPTQPGQFERDHQHPTEISNVTTWTHEPGQEFSNPRRAPSPNKSSPPMQQQPFPPIAAAHARSPQLIQQQQQQGRDTPTERQQQQNQQQQQQQQQHGGYNLMPTIHNPKSPRTADPRSSTSQRSPVLGSLNKSEQAANAASAPINQPVRLRDPSSREKNEGPNGEGNKEKKKEDGCAGCCAVM